MIKMNIKMNMISILDIYRILGYICRLIINLLMLHKYLNCYCTYV